MSQDISGVGIQVQLTASTTFPNGLLITQFASDADPVDAQTMQIADKAMGLNGNKVNWSVATDIAMSLNLIPDGDDDVNLGVLGEANRVGLGKTVAKDVITAVVTYPNGRTSTLSGGTLISFMPTNSVDSGGKLKSKPYEFSFENITRTN